MLPLPLGRGLVVAIVDVCTAETEGLMRERVGWSGEAWCRRRLGELKV